MAGNEKKPNILSGGPTSNQESLNIANCYNDFDFDVLSDAKRKCPDCEIYAQKLENAKSWKKFCLKNLVNTEKIVSVMQEYERLKQLNMRVQQQYLELQLAYDQRSRDWQHQQDQLIDMYHEIQPLKEKLEATETDLAETKKKCEYYNNLYDGMSVNTQQLQAKIQYYHSLANPGLNENLTKKLTLVRNNLKRMREISDSKSCEINEMKHFIQDRRLHHIRTSKKALWALELAKLYGSAVRVLDDPGDIIEEDTWARLEKNLQDTKIYVTSLYDGFRAEQKIRLKGNRVAIASLPSLKLWLEDFDKVGYFEWVNLEEFGIDGDEDELVEPKIDVKDLMLQEETNELEKLLKDQNQSNLDLDFFNGEEMGDNKSNNTRGPRTKVKSENADKIKAKNNKLEVSTSFKNTKNKNINKTPPAYKNKQNVNKSNTSIFEDDSNDQEDLEDSQINDKTPKKSKLIEFQPPRSIQKRRPSTTKRKLSESSAHSPRKQTPVKEQDSVSLLRNKMENLQDSFLSPPSTRKKRRKSHSICSTDDESISSPAAKLDLPLFSPLQQPETPLLSPSKKESKLVQSKTAEDCEIKNIMNFVNFNVNLGFDPSDLLDSSPEKIQKDSSEGDISSDSDSDVDIPESAEVNSILDDLGLSSDEEEEKEKNHDHNIFRQTSEFFDISINTTDPKSNGKDMELPTLDENNTQDNLVSMKDSKSTSHKLSKNYSEKSKKAMEISEELSDNSYKKSNGSQKSCQSGKLSNQSPQSINELLNKDTNNDIHQKSKNSKLTTDVPENDRLLADIQSSKSVSQTISDGTNSPIKNSTPTKNSVLNSSFSTENDFYLSETEDDEKETNNKVCDEGNLLENTNDTNADTSSKPNLSTEIKPDEIQSFKIKSSNKSNNESLIANDLDLSINSLEDNEDHVTESVGDKSHKNNDTEENILPSSENTNTDIKETKVVSPAKIVKRKASMFDIDDDSSSEEEDCVPPVPEENKSTQKSLEEPATLPTFFDDDSTSSFKGFDGTVQDPSLKINSYRKQPDETSSEKLKSTQTKANEKLTEADKLEDSDDEHILTIDEPIEKSVPDKEKSVTDEQPEEKADTTEESNTNETKGIIRTRRQRRQSLEDSADSLSQATVKNPLKRNNRTQPITTNQKRRRTRSSTKLEEELDFEKMKDTDQDKTKELEPIPQKSEKSTNKSKDVTLGQDKIRESILPKSEKFAKSKASTDSKETLDCNSDILDEEIKMKTKPKRSEPIPTRSTRGSMRKLSISHDENLNKEANKPSEKSSKIEIESKTSPDIKENIPMTRQRRSTRSKTKSNNSIVEPETPVPEPKSSIAKPQLTIVSPKSPIASPKSPIVSPKSPIVEPKSPITEAKSSNVEPELHIAETELSIAEPKSSDSVCTSLNIDSNLPLENEYDSSDEESNLLIADFTEPEPVLKKSEITSIKSEATSNKSIFESQDDSESSDEESQLEIDIGCESSVDAKDEDSETNLSASKGKPNESKIKSSQGTKDGNSEMAISKKLSGRRQSAARNSFCPPVCMYTNKSKSINITESAKKEIEKRKTRSEATVNIKDTGLNKKIEQPIKAEDVQSLNKKPEQPVKIEDVQTSTEISAENKDPIPKTDGNHPLRRKAHVKKEVNKNEFLKKPSIKSIAITESVQKEIEKRKAKDKKPTEVEGKLVRTDTKINVKTQPNKTPKTESLTHKMENKHMKPVASIMAVSADLFLSDDESDDDEKIMMSPNHKNSLRICSDSSEEEEESKPTLKPDITRAPVADHTTSDQKTIPKRNKQPAKKRPKTSAGCKLLRKARNDMQKISKRFGNASLPMPTKSNPTTTSKQISKVKQVPDQIKSSPLSAINEVDLKSSVPKLVLEKLKILEKTPPPKPRTRSTKTSIMLPTASRKRVGLNKQSKQKDPILSKSRRGDDYARKECAKPTLSNTYTCPAEIYKKSFMPLPTYTAPVHEDDGTDINTNSINNATNNDMYSDSANDNFDLSSQETPVPATTQTNNRTLDDDSSDEENLVIDYEIDHSNSNNAKTPSTNYPHQNSTEITMPQRLPDTTNYSTGLGTSRIPDISNSPGHNPINLSSSVILNKTQPPNIPSTIPNHPPPNPEPIKAFSFYKVRDEEQDLIDKQALDKEQDELFKSITSTKIYSKAKTNTSTAQPGPPSSNPKKFAGPYKKMETVDTETQFSELVHSYVNCGKNVHHSCIRQILKIITKEESHDRRIHLSHMLGRCLIELMMTLNPLEIRNVTYGVPPSLFDLAQLVKVLDIHVNAMEPEISILEIVMQNIHYIVRSPMPIHFNSLASIAMFYVSFSNLPDSNRVSQIERGRGFLVDLLLNNVGNAHLALNAVFTSVSGCLLRNLQCRESTPLELFIHWMAYYGTWNGPQDIKNKLQFTLSNTFKIFGQSVRKQKDFLLQLLNILKGNIFSETLRKNSITALVLFAKWTGDVWAWKSMIPMIIVELTFPYELTGIEISKGYTNEQRAKEVGNVIRTLMDLIIKTKPLKIEDIEGLIEEIDATKFLGPYSGLKAELVEFLNVKKTLKSQKEVKMKAQ